MVTLYLETNFLIGLARNQDPESHKLLDLAVADEAELAVPQVCLMEAITAVTSLVHRQEN
jgi:predicted nucleic acid-binding protein